MEVTMKKLWISSAIVLAALIGFSGSARAQSAQTLPVPGYDASNDLPGAKELPNPSMTYKVVFDIGKALQKLTK
jgi:hypothetical protein